MRQLDLHNAPHTIAIGLSSLILLALSIAVIALEARVQDAFRNEMVQYPGSSIVEFTFVPLNPPNINPEPTIVKFATGACSLIVSLLGIAWSVQHWYRANNVHIRMVGSAVCVAAVTNTAAGIGFAVYLFISEAQGHLPQYYKQWGSTSFTKEFYVCEAVPSIFPNADAVFKFPACKTSRAAKYLLLATCCVSVVLAGLSVLQAHRDGVFAVFIKAKSRYPHMEKARRGRAKENGLPRRPDMVHATSESTPHNLERIHDPSTYASRSRTSLHGYYAKI